MLPWGRKLTQNPSENEKLACNNLAIVSTAYKYYLLLALNNIIMTCTTREEEYFRY